jgi:pimeloyl-ACP methyl ester carboxylesterase
MAMAASADQLMADFPAWIAANTDPFFAADTIPETKQWVQRLMLGTSMFAAAQLARANFAGDFRGDLRRVNVPTLVVHGDLDMSAPVALTGTRTATLIPFAQLLVYDGAPHGLPLTHAARLREDMLIFMAATGA